MVQQTRVTALNLLFTLNANFFARDQLWTNDGGYVRCDADEEYPPDLKEYPEPGVGWMNEEGIRIDIQHRLIPKIPLRPALKRTSISGSSSGTVALVRPETQAYYSPPNIRE